MIYKKIVKLQNYIFFESQWKYSAAKCLITLSRCYLFVVQQTSNPNEDYTGLSFAPGGLVKGNQYMRRGEAKIGANTSLL